MLTFFIFILLSFSNPIKKSNKILKARSISLKGSTDLPPEVLPSLNAAITTVLFKKGKNLTEVNDISDAIIHCRGCSGKDIPAGAGLLKEMTYFDSYKELFGTQNGTIARKISELLASSAKKLDEGNITGSGSQVIQCLTLGHYVPQYKYNIPFKCTESNGVRTCIAEGNVTFSGRDYWDFESLSSNSFWQNLVTEKIPEILVNLKGPAIPFGIPFNDSIHFTIKREVEKDVVVTSQPSVKPPTPPPAQSLVTSQPTTTQNYATSQPTTIVTSSSQTTDTSQPTTTQSTATSQPTTIVTSSSQITVTSQPTTTQNSATSQPTTIVTSSFQTTVTSKPLTAIPSSQSTETSQPSTASSQTEPSYTHETSSSDAGSVSSRSNSGKKKKKTVYIAVAVVCVVVVAVVAVGVFWFIKKRRNPNIDISEDQVTTHEAMQMALIP